MARNDIWGYRKLLDGSVVIDPEERYVIEKIFNMYAEGNGSRTISRILYENGVRNRKGKPLAESQIRAIVQNPVYMGSRNPKQDIRLPAIVSRELWDAANHVIEENKIYINGRTRGWKKGNHILSGKIFCGECGQRYWRNQKKITQKYKYEPNRVYWYCSSRYRINDEGVSSQKSCSSMRLKEGKLLEILEKIETQHISQEMKNCLRETINSEVIYQHAAKSLQELKSKKEQDLLMVEVFTRRIIVYHDQVVVEMDFPGGEGYSRKIWRFCVKSME